MTTAARTPPPDADLPDDPLADDPWRDGETAGLGERIAAWFAPTPAEVLALALLLVGSVAATLVWWYGSVAVSGDATTAAAAGVPVEVADGASPDPPAASPPGAPDPVAVTVHVSGAVDRPGLLTLPASARVGDAVAAAGGLTGDADHARVNLARIVVDGEQIHVPVEGEEPPAGPAGGGGPDGVGAASGEGGGGDGPAGVDLNRASASELEQLPGIGPTRAAAIVAHREQHGPFAAPGDLRAVSGIGETTFQNLAPLVVVR